MVLSHGCGGTGAASASAGPAARRARPGAGALASAPPVDSSLVGRSAAGSTAALVGCEAELEPRGALTAFQEVTPDLRNCYERALRTDPTLEVSVHLRIQVNMRGEVMEAGIEESLPESLKACLLDVASEVEATPVGGRGAGDCAVMLAPVNFRPSI
ncbi:MAG: hypothetical protein AB8I08_37035 [Sandaracinaceae bacterium]